MKDNENLLNYKKFIYFDNLINFMSLKKKKMDPAGLEPATSVCKTEIFPNIKLQALRG